MDILSGLATITVLGVLAQWIAWRFRFPSIIILLFFGFLAGPVTGLISPDKMFGELLFPMVALSVALILFEGGLGLSFSDLLHSGKVIRNLVTVGAIVTAALTAVGAFFLLGFSRDLSILLGAILVVTGPTVIGPMLRQLKPTGQVGSILKWEGIMIDPIGAMLAVLVFQAILAGGLHEALPETLAGIVRTLIAGSFSGAIGAVIIVVSLKRHWIPDFLQNPMSLMIVVGVYTLSHYIQPESGLLGATVMGMVLANQNRVSVKRIVEFKENLRVLLISALFIILAARIDLADMPILDWHTVLFVVFLVVVVRPASVFLSSFRSKLSFKEKIFLSGMAPRGIVAAAVVSVFSFELYHLGVDEASMLVPVTFKVIIGTVLIYSIVSHYLGNRLKLTNPNPQGVLFVGAHDWAQAIAKALMDEGIQVRMIDTNYDHVSKARMKGIPASQTNVTSQSEVQEIDLEGMGYLVALTSNDEVNSLATIRFEPVFGSTHVFQLPSAEVKPKEAKGKSDHLQGRFLFDKKASFGDIENIFYEGAEIKKTRLTKEFDFDAFKEYYQQKVMPLFLITQDKELVILTTDKKLTPKAGQTLISMIYPLMSD